MVGDSNSSESKQVDCNVFYTTPTFKIRLLIFDKHKNGWTLWFNRKYNGAKWYHSKSISFGNYYGVWKKPNEVSFRTNGAKKGNSEDTCYDSTLVIGKLNFGYTNWSY